MVKSVACKLLEQLATAGCSAVSVWPSSNWITHSNRATEKHGHAYPCMYAQSTGPPSALYYICDYMGGRTCWDTPIYHIWLHSYPLNIQSKVSKSPFLVVSCTICNLLQVSNSSLPLAMEWRIHRRKRSIWNIPEDFLISASSPHWPMKFQWSF